jgi:hypothetical protein
MLERGKSTESNKVALRYFSTGPGAAVLASMISQFQVVDLVTTMEASHQTRARSEDHMGNVKIPRFEALNTTIAADGWRLVPPLLEPEDYSSMVGVPVFGLPKDKEMRFNLESTYISAECQPFIQTPYSFNITPAIIQRLSSLMRFNFSATHESGWMPGAPDQSTNRKTFRSFFFDTDRKFSLARVVSFLGLNGSSLPDTDPHVAASRRLVFGSLFISNKAPRTTVINLTNCTLHQTPVESAVFCPGTRNGGNCYVSKIRLSLTDRRPRSVTVFDRASLQKRLSHGLPEAISSSGESSSMVERFLVQRHETNVRADDDFQTMFFHDVSQLPPATFSRRFSVLLNTFYHSQGTSERYAYATPPNGTEFPTAPVDDIFSFVKRPAKPISSAKALSQFENDLRAKISAAVIDYQAFIPVATNGTAQRHTPIYVCNFAWLAVLLVASGTLLATGVASLAMQLRCTLAPDVLRYVASLTYANPFVTTPRGGTALDGMTRAKLLYDVPVRLGDINADGDVGEVAFVAVDEKQTRELDRSRFYV